MPQSIHRGIKSLIDEANAEIETVSAQDAIKAAQREPGIYRAAELVDQWIPGSRLCRAPE